MTRIFKDEKIFNKFKKQFRFIFKNKNFINLTQNHFNKNGSFAVFTIAFLQNRVGEETIFNNVRVNTNDWINLFYDLYMDESIKLAQNTLFLNPLVTIENIESNFDCFNIFIEKLFQYVEEQGWDLRASKVEVQKLFTNVFGYLMYNSIECKLERELPDIVKDPNYDVKYSIILNNTKLFAKAKNSIRAVCGLKINDLIVLMLGGSNHLALDK